MLNSADPHRYDDMLLLPHPVSPLHPPMPVLDRAAQFAPFAALTGHEAAIRETARLTEKRIELDENEKKRLDVKLRLLLEHLGEHPYVNLLCFIPDAHKSGGSYETISGNLKRLDEHAHQLFFTNGRQIPVADIYDIQFDV